MKLSTRAKYGLRICFLLALNGGFASLSQLVGQTNLSEKYLEQLLRMLKTSDIVGAKRGATGGYFLTKSPKDISINEILTALKDNFEFTNCIKGECEDEYCPNRRLILKLYGSIDKLLNSTSLQDMLDDIICNGKTEQNGKIEGKMQ